MTRAPRSRHRVCIVGSGWRFTSGISYYTCQLANAFADRHQASAILMRQLMPRRLYPGWRRVGQSRAAMAYRPDVGVCDGVDWWWGRSLVKALSFLAGNRPRVLVLQWWTATVLHTYLVLALAGRLLGARVVVELHELQDPGEGRFALPRAYGRHGLRLLLSLAHGCVVHSAADRDLLQARYRRASLLPAIAPHGPFDQYHLRGDTPRTPPVGADRERDRAQLSAVRQAPRAGVANLLFFGTIRPYKGLEDLLEVFNSLDASEAAGLWLTVVGETWEGCTGPARLIAASPHADRITFVNDYVADEVVSAAFAHADVVVLPYRRSSSSGPLHVAMSWGLPVVITRVGGLPEAADGYGGAIFVPPGDRQALKAAIRQAVALAGQRFGDPRSWAEPVGAILHVAGLAAGEPALTGVTT